MRPFDAWLRFYNEERQHQSLGYRTPRQIYEEGLWICGRSASPTGSASPASRASSASGWEPEVHRLMGDLLLRRNPSAPDRAEISYRRAIERARSQEARSWELRAGTSLARLWRDQGKRTAAHDLLGPVYGWFTEGLDTADLKDAKISIQGLDRALSE
jgi:hypothetical protein